MDERLLCVCRLLVVAILLSFVALLSVRIADYMVVRHLEDGQWQNLG